MMMRWLVTVHQLAREMHQADTWVQSPRDKIAEEREIKPITWMVVGIFALIVFVANRVIANPETLRRYVD